MGSYRGHIGVIKGWSHRDRRSFLGEWGRACVFEACGDEDGQRGQPPAVVAYAAPAGGWVGGWGGFGTPAGHTHRDRSVGRSLAKMNPGEWKGGASVRARASLAHVRLDHVSIVPHRPANIWVGLSSALGGYGGVDAEEYLGGVRGSGRGGGGVSRPGRTDGG